MKWHNQWIDVELAIPKSETLHVIGYIKQGPAIEQSSMSLNRSDDLWRYVTHWMPLPPPPDSN